jgi:hypothetical protein
MWIETSKGMVNTDHLALVKWSLTSTTADEHGKIVATLDLFWADAIAKVTLDEEEGVRFVHLLRGLKDTAMTLPDELAPVTPDQDE